MATGRSHRLENPEAFGDILTRDPGMAEVLHQAELISRTREPVLVTGETGVGKELMARAIHRANGVTGRFVAVNVAGLDDNVFSDTLFGHVRGAFTGADRNRPGLIERASSGSLFLDEIGDLTSASQVKLLRLLQDGEYLPLGRDAPRHSDTRIIAATNTDLWTLQRAGRFRKDLNYRLRTHHVHLPPLRDRRADIPLLLDHFLGVAAKSQNKPKPALSKALAERMARYAFPGNVRQIQAMCSDAVSRLLEGKLSMDLFEAHIRRPDADEPPSAAVSGGAPDAERLVAFGNRLPTLKQMTALLVREAMQRADGNQTVAARLLGISQPALSKRLKNLNTTD